jgi:hypothetical protein
MRKPDGSPGAIWRNHGSLDGKSIESIAAEFKTDLERG